MQVQNLTGNTYFLGRVDLRLNPGATLTVPDATYNFDNAVAQAIHSLDDENKATITSPPVGYPRDLGGSEGGGGVPEVVAQDIIDDMLTNSPLILWAGQETSGQLQDSSGNGLHSTTATANGYVDGGPLGVGADRFIAKQATGVVSRAVVAHNTSDFSFEFCILPYGACVVRSGTAANGWVTSGNGTSLTFTLPNSVAFGNTITLNPGVWQHIFIKRTAGGTWTGWKNGVLATTFGTNGMISPTSTLAYESGGAMGIAYFAMYNSALSDARILEKAQLLGLAA